MCSPLPFSRADDIQKGLRPRRSIRTAMAHEINMYGEKMHLNAVTQHF